MSIDFDEKIKWNDQCSGWLNLVFDEGMADDQSLKCFFLLTHPFLWWRMDDLVDTRPGSPACCPFGAGPIWALTCPSSPSRNLSHQSAKEKKVSISLKNNRNKHHSCCSYLVDKEKVKGEIIFFVSIHVHKCTLYKGKKNIENWVCFLESRYDIICLC